MNSNTLKLFLICILFALTACDTQPVKPDPTETVDKRPISEKQATLTEEANRLIDLADDADTTDEQHDYRSRAIYLLIEAGQLDLARAQFNTLKSSMPEPARVTPTQAADISLIDASFAVAEKNPTLAEQHIASTKAISRDQQIRYYALKADIDFLSGNYMFAVDRRTQLASYLPDDASRMKNNEKIWAALSSLSTTQLNAQHSDKPTIRGWLDLARVMRSGQQNIGQLENDLLDWGTRNPSHPVGEAFLSNLIDDYKIDESAHKQIAIILPMQGKFAEISANVKNGFLAAYYNDTKSPRKPTIKFYDNSIEGVSFMQLYKQAIEDGATNIIGPLDKRIISLLSHQRELDVPVLTLNYSEKKFIDTENLFQFGLSPEDEARQVAELAVRQNHLRAAVFHPDSDWGKRLNDAFTQHFEALGGKVLAVSDYATNTNDYRRSIRALFNLDQSTIRRRKVENTISKRTHGDAFRRDDIDMIFMAATHQAARGIMPAFKFHHAGDLPVFSTSHVYTGKVDRELDRDLNGLTFCDLPWVLQNTSPLAASFKRNWPQQENYTRLFALGIDAYHLIYNLEYLENKEYAFYDGQTGNIQLDENNRVTRQLLWAKFSSGKPVYFEPYIRDPEESAATLN